MLRVLSLVCPICPIALRVALLTVLVTAPGAPCGMAQAASVAAWPSPSQHAPNGALASSPDSYVLETQVSAGKEFEPAVGHGRLVSPQVWEHYSRRPVARGRRGEAVQAPVMPPLELSPARPARRNPSQGRIVAKPAPKKTTTAAPSGNTPTRPVPPKDEPAKTAGSTQQPAPVVVTSPTPVPTQPAPTQPAPVVRKETPAPAPEDNISASWIIRRDPAPAQPAPSPAVTPAKPATPPAGESAAGAGTPEAPLSSETPSGV